MSSTTPYVGLYIADTSEKFPLSQMNSNMDKIDAQLNNIGGDKEFTTITGGKWLSTINGFSILETVANKFSKRGAWGIFEVQVQRSSTMDAGRDILNIKVGTTSVGFRPKATSPIWTIGTAPIISGYIDTTGSIYITAVGGTSLTIPKNTRFTISSSFLLQG